MMDKATARFEAKEAALHFAIEGLQNRLENDIIDPNERAAYQAELQRLFNQQRKLPRP